MAQLTLGFLRQKTPRLSQLLSWPNRKEGQGFNDSIQFESNGSGNLKFEHLRLVTSTPPTYSTTSNPTTVPRAGSHVEPTPLFHMGAMPKIPPRTHCMFLPFVSFNPCAKVGPYPTSRQDRHGEKLLRRWSRYTPTFQT